MAWVKHALKAIKQHPEIFKALEEFEKTGKLPEFTSEFIKNSRKACLKP